MTISKLVKVLGAAALACGFAWGGARTFGQIGGLAGGQDPARRAGQQGAAGRADPCGGQAPIRAGRVGPANPEARKALQDIRADLRARQADSKPSVASKTAIRLAEAINAGTARAVSRLANALERHPGEVH